MPIGLWTFRTGLLQRSCGRFGRRQWWTTASIGQPHIGRHGGPEPAADDASRCAKKRSPIGLPLSPTKSVYVCFVCVSKLQDLQVSFFLEPYAMSLSLCQLRCLAGSLVVWMRVDTASQIELHLQVPWPTTSQFCLEKLCQFCSISTLNLTQFPHCLASERPQCQRTLSLRRCHCLSLPRESKEVGKSWKSTGVNSPCQNVLRSDWCFKN